MVFWIGRGLSRGVRTVIGCGMERRHIGFLVLEAILWLFFGFSLFHSCLITFILFLATGGWRYWKGFFVTFKRDMTALAFLIHAKRKMREYQDTNQTVVDLFKDTMKRHPDKVAYIMVDGKHWTFREVDEYSNAVANYLHSNGYQKGDVVAMFLGNSPQYVCLWLGMAKVGVVAALINFNLRQESLAHCIKASGARSLIFGSDMSDAVEEARSQLPLDLKFLAFGGPATGKFASENIEAMIRQSSTMPPPRNHLIKFNDTLFYIYTSGTTGLPKAAIVIHSRFYYMAYSLYTFFKMKPSDIIYDTLPLYHTAGGVLGVGQALINGCTVVIRSKFSASRFWDECIKYNCTVVQYIGELCRYLLAQPRKPEDTNHRVRVAYGNGLRPQIWTKFTNRFCIERVGEFYGATEGNANIVNSDNTVGAVGFTSVIAPFAYPVTLIRVTESGELMRDSDGMCIKCKQGQPGELVGKIVQGDPLREFDGYVNPEATKKKVAKNVFTRGDTAFLTGDVLVMDEYGYMFFRDRTGDTFRWRGENVSTAEVEATISNILKLKDTVVYGVEVPGSEGRAGMVAIVDEKHAVDLVKLGADLQKALPAYARPIFIRILDKLDVTGTFKLKKTDYRNEGFDPSKVKDKMYYMDSKSGTYTEITRQLYDDINGGKIRI